MVKVTKMKEKCEVKKKKKSNNFEKQQKRC